MDHARGGALRSLAGDGLTLVQPPDGTDEQGVGNLGVNTIGRPGAIPRFVILSLNQAAYSGALRRGKGRIIRRRTAGYDKLIARDTEGFVPGSREASNELLDRASLDGDARVNDFAPGVDSSPL
jgi:hypothetical protein